MNVPAERNNKAFAPFCQSAGDYWRLHTRPGERVVVVEAMSQWLRTTLRNLTIANALRRIEPARVIVYAGADRDWQDGIWQQYDLDETRALCEAYGAELVFDIHALIDDRLAGTPNDLSAGGIPLGGDLPDSAIPESKLDAYVHATAARLLKVERPDASPRHVAKVAELKQRSHEFARIYEALFSRLDVVALVSSHVDYNNFGLAVEAALRHDVPVLFTQSTGTLKSYAIWPENVLPDEPVRASITREVGRFFEDKVWPHQTGLSLASERTASRAKAALGLPSWWRSGGATSSIMLQGPHDRALVRTQAAIDLGLDPGKPTITVFNHAISDALGTNVEAFEDLATWFQETAAFAADHPEANWLFLDHPSQASYDDSDFVGRVAANFGGAEHMVFTSSTTLSKNVQVALSDLVLTVRGSVSTEFPTLGIPALMAGWSDWSMCGFTMVATTVADYFGQLGSAIASLLAGEPLITPEQVRRARLWMWFYRSSSDVPSGIVPHWQMGEITPLWRQVMTAMEYVEPDGDLAFSSVRRLWQRRDPLLTRNDWDRPDPVGELTPMES